MTRFVVAAAQYPIDRLASWQAYADKLSAWVAGAAGQGASLAVFPEYASMELAALDPATMGDLGGSLAAVAALLPRIDALHAELAQQHRLHILAASAPCRLAEGHFVNRARLFAPSGRMGFQDKLIMTRFEREQWGVRAGQGLALFDTELGKIGINICYDSEFPLLSRALCEAGMQVLLVPSCTDSLHGYWRVRHGAQARALEGQCHAVHAPTVGAAPWSPAVDINHGAAAIHAPPDGMHPADGVLAIGALDQPQWLFGMIDTADTDSLRATGGVRNWRHWEEQPGAGGLPPVSVIAL